MVTSTDAVASPPPPTAAELALIAAGDPASCNDLVRRWDTPVLQIAAGHAPLRGDREDLAQAGRLAVIRAAKGYDPKQGAFGHYAKRAIRFATTRDARSLVRQRRLDGGPLEDNPEAIDQLVAGGDGGTRWVKEWVGTLPEALRRIYQLLYVESYTQREAAAQLGVTQPRVAQLNSNLLSLGAIALAN